MQRTPNQASKLKLPMRNGLNKKTNKNDSISTPIPSYVDSPPTLEDSPSPIPFLCTQDESEVVWNYYSPTSENGSPTNTIDNTPRARKRKKQFYYKDYSPITRIPMKKKFVRPAVRNTEFLKGLRDELTALNQNFLKRVQNNNNSSKNENNGLPIMEESMCDSSSDEKDIFTNTPQDCLPKQNMAIVSTPRISNTTLEREFEDSMNDLLIQATECAEDIVATCSTTSNNLQQSKTNNLNSKSKIDSPKITNDSLDSLLSNINEDLVFAATQAELRATQAETKSSNSISSNTVTSSNQRNSRSNSRSNVNSSVVSNSYNSNMLNDSRTRLMRHNSMPESPGRNPPVSKSNVYRGKTFTRHISMPVSGAKLVVNSEEFSQVIKCTPEDIRRKHEAAKEKLMAKKLEPAAIRSQAFYGHSTTSSSSSQSRRVSSSTGARALRTVSSNSIQMKSDAAVIGSKVGQKEALKPSLQEQIEKKRQDALLKLQRNRSLAVKK